MKITTKTKKFEEYLKRKISELTLSRAEALKGIDKFSFVYTEFECEELAKLELTYKKMKEFILSRLRENGVTVWGENYLEERQKEINQHEPSMTNYPPPDIYLNVNIAGQAYNIYLEVQDDIRLERNSEPLRVAIWRHSITGTHRNDGRFIMDSLRILIDQFLIDYFRTNPQIKK